MTRDKPEVNVGLLHEVICRECKKIIGFSSIRLYQNTIMICKSCYVSRLGLDKT